MREYITELSKYGMVILMALYTLCGFICLADRMEKRRILYTVQNMLMFFVQLLMFADLALSGRNRDYLFLYLFVQVFLVAAVVAVPLIYENANRLLLNNMGMLLGTGICIISRLSFNRAVKQYIIMLISLMIAMFIPWLMMQIRFLKKMTWIYALAGLALLGAVFVLGDVTRGSMLTIELWSVSFQPSEFVKLIFVFFLAGALWDRTSFGQVGLTALVAGSYVIILVVSRDLGSALIFFVSYVFIVVAAAGNYLYFAAGAAGGCGAAWAAYRLFAHVRTRVLAWKDPWTYIDFQGYAITQSLFAIGSGSWFGMGLLKGNPDAIPYVEEDFTFSAVCEELGVAFGICVLLVMLVNFFVMMKMAARIKDRFYQIIVYGIGIMYIFQIFLTVGGGIRLIPLTGVTLPFVSYGGSSVMVTMIMFFIVEGIYMRLQQEGVKHNAGRKGQKAKENASGRTPGGGMGAASGRNRGGAGVPGGSTAAAPGRRGGAGVPGGSTAAAPGRNRGGAGVPGGSTAAAPGGNRRGGSAVSGSAETGRAGKDDAGGNAAGRRRSP